MLRRAFTLIELLTVIAIIGITAALLSPVFLQVRKKSYEAVCASNLRQIGAAIAMYRDDFDSVLVPKYNCKVTDPFYPDHCIRPRRNSNAQMEAGTIEWLPTPDAPLYVEYLLKPFIKNNTIFACPARTTGEDGKTQGRYTLNSWDSKFGQGNPETGPQGQPETNIAEQSKTILVMEHTNAASECQGGQIGATGDYIAPSPGHWDTQHSDGFNALYCDNHVKRLRPAKLGELETICRNWFTIQKYPANDPKCN